MALYEYRCSSCGSDFEVRRPMSEAGLGAPCPECGEDANWLPSVFASKDGYSLRVPTGQAFRSSRGPDQS